MAPSLVTIEASEPLEKIVDIIARDGGVIVANFLSSELLKESMAAIEPHLAGRKMYNSSATHEELGDGFFPEGSQRVYGLLAKMPNQLVKIMRLPLWQGVMERFLNDEYFSYTGDKLLSQKSGYMLASTAALRLLPGAKPQPLHRDQIAYLIRPEPSNPLFTPMVGVLIAGSKCTYKNGATAVIPGSHLWGPERAPKLEECAYAEMEPGSALITLGSTYHGAGENKCERTDLDAKRTLIAVFGQRDYYRADQDEDLSTPIEIARKLPEDILKLAGYYKAVGGVGYVEDHQNPFEFLKREDPGLAKYGPATTQVAL
ncbi:uncharacterized protein LY89DRAFT_692351 [Mollisia scopiformis]|uniref:Phytanoyl-CoA dioxygenase n=1 Tax=Mollisia scopiformis TaxID=149040 RepID=A0A132B3C8_MOLSC|nr:uncharacterized protein LY89DRAFT_692351 [Mollisia scopiformis]KUJ06753.1 hypothetical protein LY89DRAFT_692351 [Mollisia scopiformis]